MYLDALFVISPEGIKNLVNMEVDRRLDYVLGSDEDDSFTDFMIDIVDFGGTINLFYDVLTSSEFNLLELLNTNMDEFYKDKYFKMYHIGSSEVKSLNNKLSAIDLQYIKSTMVTAENISGKPIYSGYDKYIELKELIKDASKKNAELLLVMRVK